MVSPEIPQNPEYGASDLPKALDLVKINGHWAQVVTADQRQFSFHLLEAGKYITLPIDSLTLVKKINCLLEMFGYSHGEVVPQAVQTKIYLAGEHDAEPKKTLKDMRVFGFYQTKSDQVLSASSADGPSVEPEDFGDPEVN